MGHAQARAAVARFDSLAPGDPEAVESFTAPRAKAGELVDAALKASGKGPDSDGYEEIKAEQTEKVLSVGGARVKTPPAAAAYILNP